MELTITGNTEVVLVEEKKVTLTKLTIQRMVDLPNQKKVVCFVKEIPTPIVLWEGATYDSIGQWTDVNVIDRIKQIYGL
jgi:hypothetical protein